METLLPSDLRSVLILKTDRLYAEMLRRAVLDLAPHASVELVHSVPAAVAANARQPFDLILTGLDASADGDVLQLLSEFADATGRARRTFVISSQIEYRILAVLHALSVLGVFDPSTESPDDLSTALRTVIAGHRYWSRSVSERLRRDFNPAQSRCQHLSTTEQLVLSVLGDGSDDSTAAQALGVSPATISTFRRKLHRKLHVQHRGELIRVAAQNGFVRFTPSGIVRPGFGLLAAECLARKRKRRAAAAAAVAAFMTGTTAA